MMVQAAAANKEDKELSQRSKAEVAKLLSLKADLTAAQER